MPFDLVALGARIANIRTCWKMSQSELARLTSFPVDHIINVENGKLEPSTVLMLNLSLVFHLEISYIIGDTFSYDPIDVPDKPKPDRRRI